MACHFCRIDCKRFWEASERVTAVPLRPMQQDLHRAARKPAGRHVHASGHGVKILELPPRE
jgi:hypothetical protein